MKRSTLLLTALAGVVLCPGTAHARCCTQDPDCPRGFSCLAMPDPDGGSPHGPCSSDYVICECDADCAPGLRCFPGIGNYCIQHADGGETCFHGRRCLAPWQVPCSTDADCGPGGFQCAGTGGVCTGSDCGTSTRCKDPALPLTCTQDAECPTGWTCEPDTAEIADCVPTWRSCPVDGCPPPTG